MKKQVQEGSCFVADIIRRAWDRGQTNLFEAVVITFNHCNCIFWCHVHS